MARVMKHDNKTAVEILRHCERAPKTYRNTDINLSLTSFNHSFIEGDYELYKKRLSEIYVYNRKDVKTLCSWVVTLPREYSYVPSKHVNELMNHVHNFLCKRYGRENAIQSVVHYDESQPHLHFNFIPVAADLKKHKESGLKLCAADVINREDLQTFHDDLRDYLNNAHLDPKIFGSRPGDYFYTGTTKAQGGNRSVDQLKRERDLQRVIDQKDRQIEKLQARVQELEREISVEQKRENTSCWEYVNQDIEHELNF